jgi:hypothetical protein
MNRNDPILNEVAALVMHSLEGDLPADRFEYFKDLLQRDSRARAYYYRLLSIHATLQEAESLLMLHEDSLESDYQEALNALSIEEKTAPTVDMPRQEPAKAIIPKIHYEKVPHPLRKSAVVTFVISVAAMLLIALLLRFGPAPRIEVATVTRSLDAVLADGSSVTVGSRLSSGPQSRWLQKGTMEVTFDYGARVILEAPAQFNLNSAENIALHSGRLYAHVPERSKGFMVETPSSRVIDLGTEFGVKVDFDGSSDVYMMKGKASIFSGSKGQTGQGQILTAGEARRLDSKGSIETIPMREDEFAREFLLDGGLIWRGQAIDLADIVGGGCGLGTGNAQQSIDPTTGRIGPWEVTLGREGTGRYIPVESSPYIDGVFVPDGGDGSLQVTSSGILWDAPDTSNFFKYHIVNSLSIPDNPEQYAYPDSLDPKSDLMLKKAFEEDVPKRLMRPHAMETSSESSDTNIFIHANQGITFDLTAVRELLPNARITSFRSIFGTSEGFMSLEGITAESINLDLWILVDGQPKLIRQDVDAAQLIDVEIALSDTDRFLSLVITDSSDHYLASFDWGLFMNPRLEVK